MVNSESKERYSNWVYCEVQTARRSHRNKYSKLHYEMAVISVDAPGAADNKTRLTLARGRRKFTVYSQEERGGERACSGRWLASPPHRQPGLPPRQASLSDPRVSRSRDPPLALPLWGWGNLSQKLKLPAVFSFHLTVKPEPTSIPTLARVTGRRWHPRVTI